MKIKENIKYKFIIHIYVYKDTKKKSLLDSLLEHTTPVNSSPVSMGRWRVLGVACIPQKSTKWNCFQVL